MKKSLLVVDGHKVVATAVMGYKARRNKIEEECLRPIVSHSKAESAISDDVVAAPSDH